MANNQTRFELSANTDDLQLATERLKELKRLQVELAGEAQRGEKTIKEAIDAQSKARKEQIGIERLLATARKESGQEQVNATREAQRAQETLNASQNRTLGLLETERAKLKELRKAREQAQTTEEVEKYNNAIKKSQDEVNKLTGATDKFKGSNGFWRETRQLIIGAFAIDAIVDFGKEIFDITARFQKYEAILTNSLGSQKLALKAMSDIKEMAKSTPFAVDELTESYVKMVNRGVQPTMKQLKAMADVAATTGKSFEQLTEALLDGSGGSLERFTDLGIEANKMGDKISLSFKGAKIVVDESMDGMLKAMTFFQEKAPGVMGMTDTIAKTLAGSINNLGDSFDEFMLAIGNPLKETLATVISIISDLLGGITKLISGNSELTKETNIYTEHLKSLIDFLSSVYDFFVNVGVSIKDLVVGTDELNGVTSFLRQGFEGLTKVFDAVWDVLKVIFDVTSDVVGVFFKLIDNVFQLGGGGSALNKVLGFVADSLRFVGSVAIVALTGIQALIEGFVILQNTAKKVANFFGADFKIDPKATFGNLVSNAKENFNKLDTIWGESNKKRVDTTKKADAEILTNTQLNNKKIEGEAKASGEKQAKEKIDSAKTLALIQQKAANDSLEETRKTEQKSLELERDIAIQRINDSKASETKKQIEIQKIKEKYFVESSKLTDKYDNEEEKKRKAILKWLEKLRTDSLERELKAKEKYAEEGKKLDEKIAKDEYQLMLDQVELADKVRLLNKIAQAKNAEEIIKIKKDEQDKILKGTVEYYSKVLFQENNNLQKIKLQYGEQSNEYKKQKEVQLKAEKDYTKAQGQLIDEQTKKEEDALAKKKRNQKLAMDIMLEVANNVFGLIGNALDKSLNSTTDLVKQAQIKNQQQALELAKQGLSAVASLASGDIPGAIMKGIGLVFNGLDLIINGSKRKAEAAILQARQVLKTYLEFIQSDIDEFIASLETVKVLYGDIAGKGASFVVQSNLDKILSDLLGFRNLMDGQEGNKITFDVQLGSGFSTTKASMLDLFDAAARNAKDAGFSITDLINAEVKRGQKIAENAEKARSLEEANYQKIIANINSAYDLDVQKINAKYDLLSQKAAQAYNAETLAITAAGTAQLEALITNETSLASVRAEFAAKRLEVEKAFPLAATAITEGMSQAQIDAINDSIDARDAALAKIQTAYNAELATIVNAEGQKRKEYSATEKIQQTIQAGLDAAALKFQGEEIQRAKDKALAIEAAEKTKNTNLQTAETDHKAAMKKINDDYTLAIAESYKLLTALLKAQQKEIEDALANSAQKGTEEYKKLEEQLYRVKAALEAISGKTVNIPIVTTPTVDPNAPAFPVTIPPIVIPPLNIGFGGFAKGTERLPNMNGIVGTDTQLIRADIDERIMPKKINNQLRSHFGKDISNEDLARIAMVKSQTQMPNFINYSLASTGNVRELISREMKVQVNMQMENISKSIEKSTKGIVGALQDMPETSFKHDATGLHRVRKTRNTVIREKLGVYFGE